MAIPLRPTECRPLKITDCPVLKETDCTGQIYGPLLPCGSVTESGGAGVTRHRHSLGESPGTVHISFNAYSVPDQMDVYLDGTLVATTGRPVGTSLGDIMPWPLSFAYAATGQKYCTVIVTGPEGTGWEYTIDCPI